MTEILLGATFLFICKEDSRNGFNNDRGKAAFAANYQALFGKKLPHMDTIDNEGFNTQKNGGYNLSHKFSRVSAVAMKNYISLMQIAHLLNQLYELSPAARSMLIAKETLKNLWKDFIASLTHTVLDIAEVITACTSRIQIRFE